ncbi:MAG: hypothetical protein RRZ92_01185 [Bacilli bacterium]
MDDLSLMEPLKQYNSTLKSNFLANSNKAFDKLVARSGVDVEKNRKTVAEYKHMLDETKKVRDKKGKLRFLQIMLSIISVVLLVTAVLAIISCFNPKNPWNIPLYGYILIAVFFILTAIAFILIIFLVINKALRRLNHLDLTYSAKNEELLALAYRQLDSLNALYDWNMQVPIVKETTPLIEVDKFFDVKKFDYMNGKYGLKENSSKDVSTYGVVSGSIVGNPFLVVRNFLEKTGIKTYYGSIVISWTEYDTDSDGNSRTVTRTQTLTASVSKPCPGYHYETKLVFGSEVAPRLSFSRDPRVDIKWDENDIKNFVEKQEKKDHKKSIESVESSGNYTQMSNPIFESLFGGTNRDNEVEYRLLFTPLAQQNMVELLTSKAPFGDDFSFTKEKCLNYIESKHMQPQVLEGDPAFFINYDVDSARKVFNDFNTEYFKALYFDLAPILSIPLYSQHKSFEYIYKTSYTRNYTSFEEESILNSFPAELFANELSATDCILKTKVLGKEGNIDKIKVTAYSFKGIPRIDIIPVMGGDGHMHSVPVSWIEYLPISKDTTVGISDTNLTEEEYKCVNKSKEWKDYFAKYSRTNGIMFRRGLIAFLISSENNEVSYKELSSIIKHK